MRFCLASIVSHGALFAALAAPAAGVEADAAPASGGELVRIEVEFFENEGKEPVNRATVFTSRRRVRIEQHVPGAANPPPVFIYRGDQDRLLSVVESSRSYLTIERQLLERVGAGARTARREIDRQLDGVPEDQQRLFGHFLGASQLDPSRPDDPLIVTRGDEGNPVAGYACRQVRLSRSGRLLAAGCVADWDTVGLTPDDVEVFRSLALLARDAMASRSPIPKELVPGQPLDLILQLGGFPVYFERAGQVAGDNAIRVASVERLPANDCALRGSGRLHRAYGNDGARELREPAVEAGPRGAAGGDGSRCGPDRASRARRESGRREGATAGQPASAAAPACRGSAAGLSFDQPLRGPPRRSLSRINPASGRANATYRLPDGWPSFPPPAATTTN